jgi:membrane protein DedA with SNARE-associated domain
MKKYGPFAIFIMAATPLPDDILYIPLGLMRYELPKFFTFCLLGKIVLTYPIALAGRLGIRWVETILGGTGIWMQIIIILSIIIGAILTLKIDWEKLFLEKLGRV